MDYLQYLFKDDYKIAEFSFKPCYKWTTFNTQMQKLSSKNLIYVLNLVINGLPSIHNLFLSYHHFQISIGFKPCYKWTTFNTWTEYLITE